LTRIRRSPMTAKNETAASTEELREQARAVKEDLKGLSRVAKEVAQDKLGGARQKTAEYYEEGKKRASEYEDQFENYIRQRPLKSVLIAVGAGLLLGFLLSRR
jgi:ElaB/YqjD/DUF883 family membrane-anchored ribosome-binding protein